MIAVTGATGFVGSHLVRKLVARGYSVRILKRKNSKTQLIEGLTVESVIGDVTDRGSVFEAVKGCEAVFHVAGHVSFWRGSRERQNQINVQGTRNVVEACLDSKISRLVHTSSVAAIGYEPQGKLGNEETPYNWWPYRVNYCNSKYFAEQEVLQGIRQGLDAVMVNPAVIFGTGDANPNAGAMVIQIVRGKLPGYMDGGCCVCDVEDVAEGHILAFLKGKKGERYILGGENYSWKDLFRLMAETLHVQPPRWKVPSWLFSTVGYGADVLSRFTHKEPKLTPDAARISVIPAYYSSEKSIRELEYATTPFRETVLKTHEWYVNHGYL